MRDAEKNAVGHAEEPPLAHMIELDPARADAAQDARLAVPREPQDLGAAAPAEEDVGERGLRIRGSGVVDVQRDRPRRARLVVVVTADERDGRARELDVAGSPVLDEPREHAHADAAWAPPIAAKPTANTPPE